MEDIYEDCVRGLVAAHLFHASWSYVKWFTSGWERDYKKRVWATLREEYPATSEWLKLLRSSEEKPVSYIVVNTSGLYLTSDARMLPGIEWGTEKPTVFSLKHAAEALAERVGGSVCEY